MAKNERKYHDWQADAPHERAVLAGVHLPLSFDHGRGGPADLAELDRLVAAAGAEVVGQVHQQRMRPTAATYLGKGKVEELKELIAERDANLVVFDNELTPAQGRNLEKILEVNLLDRTELILDIFARRARTSQARLQVELAQLQYFLPRLRRLWSHLERQAGGIGTRGPGETQLETDRRLVNRRIAQLKRQLAGIATSRSERVKGREEFFRDALVGYTNAGKSTLMNGIAGADVYVEDQLFATLDATTRRVTADERRRFLLTDTVGFIRRLPHHLIESFQATLAEVREADLLVHVVDAGGPDPERQIHSVNQVLTDLVPEPRDTLLVFNKMDTVDAEAFANHYRRHHPDALFVVARQTEGAQSVNQAILERMKGRERVVTLQIPAASFHHLGSFHRSGSILTQNWQDDRCTVTLRLSRDELRRLQARAPEIVAVD